MVIFNSYVSLPEGMFLLLGAQLTFELLWSLYPLKKKSIDQFCSTPMKYVSHMQVYTNM
jgi:hypothetical protein